MQDLLPKIVFIVSALFLAFVYGVLTMELKIFPHAIVAEASETVADLRENWMNDLGLKPTRHLREVDKPAARAIDPANPKTAVTVRKPERMAPGDTFMASVFSDKTTNIAARLVRSDGTIVNQWNVFYTQLYPERTYANATQRQNETPATDWNVFLHGIVALPDGSIVFNFDGGRTLVRMDRCGDVIWKRDANYHHSVNITERGTFWAPRGNWADEIDANGKRVRKLDLLKAMRGAGLLGVLEVQLEGVKDRYHVNDIEELPTPIADAFPLFEAGDIVISMRSPNLVFVVDPDTEAVKWWQTGPWHRQHDPDFLPNGRISIFDNRKDHDWSQIVSVDPVSRDIEVIYRADPKTDFYSRIRGKHQHLANGNLLITETEGGRVFEVTPDGEIVWEFINLYDEGQAGVISKGVRYPPGYFTVDDWSACPVAQADTTRKPASGDAG